jgi:signal transduction histidine kinase
LTDILAGLQTGFERVARAVEYDLGDAYLVWSSVHLADWLRKSAGEFGQKFGVAKLTVRCEAAPNSRVWAPPFLLSTIFANLWSNAVQAVGAECEMTIILTSSSRFVEALIIDNGPGFDDAAAAAVFQSQYSTKVNRGGRGLLEIAEAVGRLQGRVAIAVVGASRRIQLVLPLESV